MTRWDTTSREFGDVDDDPDANRTAELFMDLVLCVFAVLAAVMALVVVVEAFQ